MGIIESAEANENILDNSDTHDMYTGMRRSYSSSENLCRPDIPIYTCRYYTSMPYGDKTFIELIKIYENCKNQIDKDTIIKTMLFFADTPELCYTNYIDKKGITLLMALICCRLSDVIFKLLPYIEKSGDNHIISDISFRPFNPYKNTELMIAIRKKLNNVAIAILKFPSVCKINNVNTFGDTALMVAIKMQSPDVVKEILHNDQFNIDLNHANNDGDTAFTLVKKFNMDINILN
jgi:hypothetical protein